MRIVVCVKPVPVTMVLDAATTRLRRDGAVAMNPVDVNAIEMALQIRDSADDAEVVLLALSTADAAESLRPGLAMGADRAVVLSGEEFEGSDLLATSLGLASAARVLQPDLVVFGASSDDGNGAMVWAAVAERMSLPLVSRAIDASVDGGRLTATRQLEYGLDVVQTDLPAVLAISGEVNTPRYPSFKDVISAKKKSIEVLQAGREVDVDTASVGARGSRTVVLGFTAAATRTKGVVIHDEGDAHEQLATFLRERHLL